jgi:hypothetical protein
MKVPFEGCPAASTGIEEVALAAGAAGPTARRAYKPSNSPCITERVDRRVKGLTAVFPSLLLGKSFGNRRAAQGAITMAVNSSASVYEPL